MKVCRLVRGYNHFVGGGGENNCLHLPGRPIFISIDFLPNIFTYVFSCILIHCLREVNVQSELTTGHLYKCTVSEFSAHIYSEFVTWDNYENNQQDALYRLIYYSKSALHVSGDVFAHHQERLTVFTVYGSVHPSCCRLVSEMSWNCVSNHPRHIARNM
jgi:hypothetical protein